MTKQQAIEWFRRIQNGTGTYPERTAFLETFGAGSIARDIGGDGEFTLGLEYGILIALAIIFDLQPGDLKILKGAKNGLISSSRNKICHPAIPRNISGGLG